MSSVPQTEHPKWTAPGSAYPGNPTPPAEETSTPFHYSINAKTFHPQPTPPSDITPPPSQSSYQPYPYPYNISFCPPETPEFVQSPSSAQSFYHGYSYVPSLTDANFSTNLYAPLRYTSPPEASTNGLSNGEHHDPFVEADSPAFQQERGNPNGSIQPPEDVETTLPDSLNPTHNDISGNGSLPQSSFGAEPETVEGEPASEGVARSFSNVNAIDSEPEAAGKYDTWRQIALEDLRSVPDEVWHEQMTMPSFFLQHFNRPRYADCRLRISVPGKEHAEVDLLLHSVLLTYSPALASKLEASEPALDGLRLIVVEVSDRFITPTAVESALYTCYGRQLRDFIGTTSNVSLSNAQDSATWMENALAFAAAGQFLGLPAVVARGLQIATRILNWDNIEIALSYALDSQAKLVAEGADSVFAPTHHLMDAGDAAPPLNSTSQYSGVNEQPPASESIIASCLKLIVDQFPENCQDWRVDRSAQSLPSIDRLPEAPLEPQNIKKPQLTRIKFGELSPAELEETPVYTDGNTQLSSILISLPYKFIEPLVTELLLRGHISHDSLGALIAERERRRRFVLQHESACSRDVLTKDPRGSLGWEEYVVAAMNPEGALRPGIARRWVADGLSVSA